MALSVPEHVRSDATELARLVRVGEVTAAELLEIAETQLARLNPKLNAVNLPMLAEARARLQQSLAGPLAGVPVLIKDAVQDYAGLPTSNGSRAFRHIVARQHSAFVQRLLDAGAVILGKSNTPELALKGVTDPKAFGVTRNPWDVSRTSGGSSGGSAAAVAAGIVPMAGANDGGGSIRIPAACCGLFGLRPSRGRVPAGPAVGEIWEGASSDHVLTRSVRDSALALDVLSGPARGDPFVVAPPALPFVEAATRATPTIAFPPVDHAATVMPAAQQAVLSLLLKTGLLGVLARLGFMEGTLANLSWQNLTLVPFTQLSNLTGTPAMSMPLYWSRRSADRRAVRCCVRQRSAVTPTCRSVGARAALGAAPPSAGVSIVSIAVSPYRWIA